MDKNDSVILVVDGGVESRIDVSETQGREEHSATTAKSWKMKCVEIYFAALRTVKHR